MLASLQSSWGAHFQTDPNLSKSRRRSTTPVSPRSPSKDKREVLTMSIYGDDHDFDYAAEMRALDALIPVDQPQVLEDGILAFAGSDQLDASSEVTTTSGGAVSSATPGSAVETPKANAVKAAPPEAQRGETSWPAVDPKLYPSNAGTTVSQHQMKADPNSCTARL
jgi:hypothetical protein